MVIFFNSHLVLGANKRISQKNKICSSLLSSPVLLESWHTKAQMRPVSDGEGLVDLSAGAELALGAPPSLVFGDAY